VWTREKTVGVKFMQNSSAVQPQFRHTQPWLSLDKNASHNVRQRGQFYKDVAHIIQKFAAT